MGDYLVRSTFCESSIKFFNLSSFGESRVGGIKVLIRDFYVDVCAPFFNSIDFLVFVVEVGIGGLDVYYYC